MGNRSENFVTPVGRFIGGSITQKRALDYQGRPKPEDKQQYEFAVAIRKDDPAINDTLGEIYKHAMSEFSAHPHITAIIQEYNFGKRGFSWKIGDGDKADKKGNISKNTVGCWVIYFKSGWVVDTVDNSNTAIDANDVKRGYFVQVAFNVAGNDDTGQNAGIYINPGIVKLVAFGEELKGGMDAEAAFKDTPVPAQLPPGASVTPVATAMPSSAPGAVQQPEQNAPQSQPTGTLPSPTASPSDVLPLPDFARGPQS